MSETSQTQNILTFRSVGVRLQPRRLRPSENHVYFEAVATHGSIRRAAQAMHIASSALNRRILDLEEEVGAALFERLPRGVRPTAAGELLLSYVRWSARELERVDSEIRQLKGESHGLIRIGLAQDLGMDLVSRVIVAHQNAHPGSSFRVDVAGPSSVCEALERDEVDLALVHAAVPLQPRCELFDRELVLCALVHREHELAGQSSVVPRDCRRFPLALLDRSLPLRGLVETMFAVGGMDVSPAFESPSGDALKAYLRCQPRAVGFALRLGEESETDGLCLIPIEAETTRPILRCLTRRGRELPAAVSTFLEQLERHSRRPRFEAAVS